LQPGETIYSLSRKYNTDVKTILDNNKLLDLSTLSIGQKIAIPLEKNLIFSGGLSEIPPLQQRTPIFYQVKPKETLYRIAKVHFNKPIESIMQLNDLNSFELSVDQNLLIGWLLEPIKPKITEITTALESEVPVDSGTNELPKDTINLYIKNKLFAEKDTLTTYPTASIKSRKEIAIWDKNAPNTNKMFALHKEAKKNSIIEIHNPLLNRTAFATVIGSVPKDSYTNDITLIISPEVAEALGALDKRFMVEVKYYQ
jgi:LysM repeat protein